MEVKIALSWLLLFKIRFITGDYSSRTPGSITKMLHTLQLHTLQQRRKDTRLIFLYRVVEGLVPAIPPTELLTPNKPGRLIKPTTTSDHHTTNTINNHIRNNNRSFTVSRCRTDQYKHSFFISTIIDWNHLDEETITAPSVEQFKQKIQQHQWSQLRCALVSRLVNIATTPWFPRNISVPRYLPIWAILRLRCANYRSYNCAAVSRSRKGCVAHFRDLRILIMISARDIPRSQVFILQFTLQFHQERQKQQMNDGGAVLYWARIHGTF